MILGIDQRAVEIVIGTLQVGDPVLIGGLHLLVAMVLGGDDAVLEDHIDGGERDPAQEDQGQARKRRLQRRTKCEELHPAIAADINLAFREGLRGSTPRPAPGKRAEFFAGTSLPAMSEPLPCLAAFQPVGPDWATVYSRKTTLRLTAGLTCGETGFS